MALIWTDKRDNIDDVQADDVNSIANAIIAAEETLEQHTQAISDLDGRMDTAEADIIALETNKANAAEVYTQQEAVRKFAYLEAALGNAVQIKDTIEASLADLEPLGHTQGRIVIFGTDYIETMGDAFTFVAEAELTITGCAQVANNKTATITSMSTDSKRLNFAAGTFTPAVETQGGITDGTDTYRITVSSDHPQTLTSLTSFDVFDGGKNLHRHDVTFPITFAGITIDYDGTTGEYIFNGTTTKAMTIIIANTAVSAVKQGKPYTASIRTTGGSASAGRIAYLNRLVPASFSISLYYGETIKSGTIIPTENYINDYVRVYLSEAGIVYNNYKIKLQLEQSASVSDWELPLPSVTSLPIHVPLRDTSDNQLELRGIPATYNTDGTVATWAARDMVFKDSDGVWKLGGHIKRIVLNGSESALKFVTSTGGVDQFNYFATDCDKTVRTGVQCDKLSTQKVGDPIKNTVRIDTQYNYKILINLDDALGITTLALFREWLSTNNLTIYYLSTEFTTTVLSTADQIALNTAEKSFDGQTNIMLSSELGQVYVKAAKNITKVIDDIKAAIALLG